MNAESLSIQLKRLRAEGYADAANGRPDTNGGRRLKTETHLRAAGLAEIEMPPNKSSMAAGFLFRVDIG